MPLNTQRMNSTDALLPSSSPLQERQWPGRNFFIAIHRTSLQNPIGTAKTATLIAANLSVFLALDLAILLLLLIVVAFGFGGIEKAFVTFAVPLPRVPPSRSMCPFASVTPLRPVSDLAASLDKVRALRRVVAAYTFTRYQKGKAMLTGRWLSSGDSGLHAKQSC